MDTMNLNELIEYRTTIKYLLVGIRIILGFVMILMFRKIYWMQVYGDFHFVQTMFFYKGFYAAILLSSLLVLVEFFIYNYPIVYLISIVLSRKYFNMRRIRLSILYTLLPLINVFMVSIILLSPFKINYLFGIQNYIKLFKFVDYLM